MCAHVVGAADLTDFLLRYSSQDGVQLQVLSASQQVIDGIKLRTVTHVLVHLINLCCHTGDSKREQLRDIKDEIWFLTNERKLF